MAKNTSQSAQPQAVTLNEAKGPRRRKARWGRRLLIVGAVLVLLIGILIAAAPTIVSTGAVSGYLLGYVNGMLRGELTAQQIALSWSGPQRLVGVRILDDQQREVVVVPEAAVQAGLWSLMGGLNLGEIRLDSPDVKLIIDGDGDISLVEALQTQKQAASRTTADADELPEIYAHLLIKDGRFTVQPPVGAPLQASAIEADVNVKTLDAVNATLAATLPGGRLTGDAEINGLTSNGQIDPRKARGQVKLATDGPVEVGALMALVRPDMQLEGRATVNANANFDGGVARGDVKLLVSQFRAPQQGAGAAPLDATLQAKLQADANKLAGDAALSGSVGQASATFDYALNTPAASISLDQLLGALLSGSDIKLPNATVDATASIDLAAIEKAAPGLLTVRPGVQIQSGRFEAPRLALRGGDAPQLAAEFRLVDVAGTADGRQATLSPVVGKFDVSIAPGRGLAVKEGRVDASFAKLALSGDAADLKANLEADLTKLQSEVGQFVDLSHMEMAGAVLGDLQLVRQSNERVNTRLDMSGKGVRWVQAGRVLDLPAASIAQAGFVTLENGAAQRVEATTLAVNLSDELVAGGRGHYELTKGAYAAELEIERLDVNPVMRRTAAFVGPNAGRFAGNLSGKAQVEGVGGAFKSSGTLLARSVSADGQPLLDGDANLTWSGVAFEPAGNQVAVASLAMENNSLSASATGVQVAMASPLTLSGDAKLSADLERLLRAIATITEMKEAPQVAGRLEVTARGNASGGKGQVVGTAALDGSVGQAQAKFDYTLDDRSAAVSVDQLLGALLSGTELKLPQTTIDGTASLNLAELQKAAPGLLALRPGVQIQSGRLEVPRLSVRGGDAPHIQTELRLAEVAGIADGRPTTLSPITAALDATIAAGRGAVIEAGRVDAPFAQVTLSGDAADLKAQLRADLTRLRTELGQFVDFSQLELAGAVEGNVQLVRQSPERVDTRLSMTGNGVRWIQEGRVLDLPTAKVEQTGFVSLRDGRAQRVEAAALAVDLGGELVANGRGHYDVTSGGYAANMDVQKLDINPVARRTAAFVGPAAGRFGGSLTGKAQVEGVGAALKTEGALLAHALTADGQPLLDGDANLTWNGVVFEPGNNKLAVAGLAVQNPSLQASATGLQVGLGTPLTLTGDAKVSADLERLMRAIAAISQMKEPPAVAGRLNMETKGASSGNAIQLTGRGGVDQLVVGKGQTAVRQERINLDYDAAIDDAAQRVTVTRANFGSPALTAQINGTVEQYRGPLVMNLKGRYEGGWDQISRILHELAPATREVITVTGKTGGEFAVTGPANQPGVRPAFRGLQTGVDVTWQSAELAGVPLGAAKLTPRLVDGRLTIPPAAIPAAGGRMNVAGVLDFTTPETEFRHDGELLVLDGVTLNNKLAQSLLSRLNPIFLHITQIDGRASMGVRDVQLPLGPTMTRGGRGTGKLIMQGTRVQPAGLMAELLALGSLGAADMYTVEISSMDFALRDGRIWYDNFAMSFAERRFDLIFRGSVGLDETLDLVVSVPVTNFMLQRAGVRGIPANVGSLLEGVRVDIPLVGTRSSPKLDLARVDFAKILENAIKRNPVETVEDVIKGLPIPLPGPGRR